MLGWVLMFFKLRRGKTGDGVVSGITMRFQFGTNWPDFLETLGNVAGPLFADEVLKAFFLDESFLVIMLGKARELSYQ